MSWVAAAIGGSALVSGASAIFGSQAARSAANTQADAATNAAQLQSQTQRDVTAEELQAQQNAQALQQQIAGQQAGQEQQAAGIAGGLAQQGVGQATGTLQNYYGQGIGSLQQGIGSLQNYYGQAAAPLAPYLSLGQGATTSLGQLYGFGGGQNGQGGTPNYSGFTSSPDYGFAFDQGLQALDRSAASKGLELSGAQLKGAQEFGQGLASQQYQNYFNRLTQLSGMGQNAANTLGGYAMQTGQGIAGLHQGISGLQTGLGQNISGLQSGLGQYLAGLQTNTATNIANQQLGLAGTIGQQQLGTTQAIGGQQIGTSQSMASLLTGGAQAQASGAVGAANAFTGALGSGVQNSLLGYGLRNQAQAIDNQNKLYQATIDRLGAPAAQSPGLQGYNPSSYAPIGPGWSNSPTTYYPTA